MNEKNRTKERLISELEDLKARLAEAEETLRAIREGEVDAIIVSGSRGDQVFSLSGTEHVYRLIVETMSEAALTVSFEGRVLYCNDQFARMLRMPAERIVGSLFEEIVPPEERGEAVLLPDQVRRGNVTRRMVFKTREGRMVPVHLSATLLNVSGGSICMVATDLSELESSNQLIRALHRQQEALRESEQRWATTLASIGDAVIATDPVGRITFMNPIAESITGWNRETAAGLPVSDVLVLIDERTRLPIENPVETVFARDGITSLSDHTLLVRRDGTEVPIDDSGAPIRNEQGGILGAVLVFREVTERRKAEEALRQAKAQAESANLAKSEFLANMSHDIRTPLAGILGIIDLLSPYLRTQEQQEYLSLMKGSAHSLLALIGDILDLSRIESGKDDVAPEVFDPVVELERLNRLFSPAVRNKGLSLTFSPDPHLPRSLRGDREKLSRILRNLISNAVKYTERGSIVVRAAVRRGPDGKATLTCSVADTGIGIPKEKMELVFQSFTRLHGSTTAPTQEGTGLGLAICRKLTELMGGEIRAESDEGCGSTFTFSVPMESAGTAEGNDGKPDDEHDFMSDLPPLRILVAEDNRINQIFLESILARAGHEVVMTSDGEEARNRLASNDGGKAFDVVLMDVQMPRMDGLEATRAIRNLPGAVSSIPIIALTAFAMKDDRERFLDSGMNAYVTKPIDWVELSRVMRNLLMGT